jgi:hypothetical protein
MNYGVVENEVLFSKHSAWNMNYGAVENEVLFSKHSS